MWLLNVTRNHSFVVIIIMKANKLHYFSDLFDNSTLHVLDMSTVHNQEYLESVYAIGICHSGSLA